MHAPAKTFTHETSNDDLASGHATSLTAVQQPCSTTLPNETLTAIFFGLSPAALTLIGRVCRQWRVVAEWILYTNVDISETLSVTSPFPYNTSRCCQTLVTYSHLARSLRKFHIRWMSDPRDCYDPRLQTVLSSLFRAIDLADNLKSLELDLGLPSLPVYPTSTSFVLPTGDMTLRSLRHISFNGTGYFAPSRLAQFLNNVPSIQYLRLPDYGDQIALLPNALPSLISFCGSSRAAAAVLPGRPVQALALIGHCSVADTELSRMAMTSIPLRHLDMSAILTTPILLRSVSRNLPMIESLKVKLALRHTLHFAMSGIRLLVALSHLLGAFYRLLTLDLSPTHVDYTGLSNSTEELFLCQSWQLACPSLRRVVFPSQIAWGYHEERQTWVPVLPKGSRKRPSFYSSSPMKKHLGALNS
ncbi:hypothetical protein PAXRUDRAFT_835304 [Paxillus rubicundulus Ve08.2h10]|uniref:F-box domain-containing protein n=1 Tax=Paxillus rubicundulus Ve08.2h10 TaxID=930991 RepID=A0A0D0DFN3_9AGAM|nr:hypothetical protein PAXRUDRAFT_835304 [Paxillus rubicundulus Ve08.2h10]